MTLTIEIPDEIADEIRALSAEERVHFEKIAADAVAHAWLSASDDEIYDLTEEDIAAIHEGIADADAGRWITADEFHQQIHGKPGAFHDLLAEARARVAESDALMISEKR